MKEYVKPEARLLSFERNVHSSVLSASEICSCFTSYWYRSTEGVGDPCVVITEDASESAMHTGPGT